jgi:hypothetical protein
MNIRLTTTVVVAGAVLALAGCGSGSPPLAQSTDCTQAGVTCTQADVPTAPVDPASAATTDAPTADPAPAASPASTCDVAREALLTGTPTSIAAAMHALQADRTAPAIAREYAQYYTGRDAGQKDQQTSDQELIQMSCPA